MKYFLLSRNWIKKKTLRFTRLLELSLNQFRLEWYLIKSYGNLFLLIIFWNRHPTSERNLIVAIDALKMMRKKLNIRARLSALVRRQKCFVSADCCNRRTSFRLSMARPNWLSFLDRFFLSHRIFIFFSLTLCCGEPMPDTVSMAGRLKSGEMKEKPRKGSKNWANKREGEREKETERERERERESDTLCDVLFQSRPSVTHTYGTQPHTLGARKSDWIRSPDVFFSLVILSNRSGDGNPADDFQKPSDFKSSSCSYLYSIFRVAYM